MTYFITYFVLSSNSSFIMTNKIIALAAVLKNKFAVCSLQFAICISLLTANCLLPTFSFAQNIAINTTGNPANASSMLDVTSLTSGILIPRMTAAQKNNIAVACACTPATGLLVYQTDGAAGFWYYDGSAWQPFGGGGSGWLLTGNGSTTPGTNYLGTSDGQDLVLKTNNQEWLRIRTATGNTTLGSEVYVGTNTVPGTNYRLYAVDGSDRDMVLFTTTGNSFASKSVLSVSSNTTGGVAAGSTKLINLSRTGANSFASHTSYGIYSSIANTGATNTNIGGYFSASGASTQNFGVQGTTSGTTSNASGVYGSATGTSGATNGVWGDNASTSNNAAGVYGTASGVTATGVTFGVFGSTVSTATAASGVYGEATGISGGVYGVNGVSSSSGGGIGVYGINNSAVAAGTQYGVYGAKSGSTGTGTGYAVFGNALGTGATNYGGYFTSSGATSNVGGYFSGTQYGIIVPAGGGSVGIGTSTPTSRLSVGASSEFQVNSTGNLVRINNVPYSFPAAQGAASTFIQNDGAGNLSWAAVSTHTRLHTMTNILDHSATAWRLFYSNAAGAVIELALPVVGQVLTSAGVAAAPVWSAGGTGTKVLLYNCETTATGWNTTAPVSACMSYALPANTWAQIAVEADIAVLGNGLNSTKDFNIYYGGVLKKTVSMSLNAADSNGDSSAGTLSFSGVQAAAVTVQINTVAVVGSMTWYVYNMRVYGIK